MQKKLEDFDPIGWLSDASIRLQRPTRRDVFRAGAASLLLGKAQADVKDPGRLDFRCDGQRFELSLNGQVAWILEAAAFSGSPVIRASRSKQAICFTLDNSLLPGSSIVADTRGSIALFEGRWKIQIEIPGLGFAGGATLLPWLTGDELLVGSATLPRTYLAGKLGTLSIRQGASGRFLPSWRFEVRGARVTDVRTEGLRLAADRLTIEPFSSVTAALIKSSVDPRTVLRLRRGRQAWSLFPDRIEDGGSALAASPGFVRELIAEVSGSPEPRLVLAADADAPEMAGEFRPAWELRSEGRENFHLPLRKLRFIADITAARRRETLWGYGSGENLHLHIGCATLSVQNTADRPVVTWARNGGEGRLESAVRLISVAADSSDAIAAHLPLGSDTIFLQGGNDTAHPSIASDPSSPGCPEVSLPNFATMLSRPEDFLSLRFQFLNYRLRTGFLRPPELVPIDRTKPGTLIVHFPPQSIGEQAFHRTATEGAAGDSIPQTLPVASRLSPPSHLAFTIPVGTRSIDYKLEQLLQWVEYPLSVAGNAKTSGTREGILPPASNVTALAVPYRMILSPDENAGWKHAVRPVAFNGRTELWHTRLGVRKGAGGHHSVDEKDSSGRMLRAIYSPDVTAHFDQGKYPDNLPFLTGLKPSDRNNIVHLSADYNIPGYTPGAMPASMVMLTSLGAWLKLVANWVPQGTAGALTEFVGWTQNTSGGRDFFVQTVKLGFLIPLGHPAVWITETERQPEQFPATGPSPVAILQQRDYIVLLKPEVAYGPWDLILTSISFKKLVTPPLDPVVQPGTGPGAPPAGPVKFFWPRVNGSDYLFELEGTDHAKTTVPFSSPLLFLVHDSDPPSALNLAISEYGSPGNRSRRVRPFADQRVAVAKPANSTQTETCLDIAQMEFGVTPAPQPPGSQFAPFRPLTSSYQATTPSLSTLLGNSDGGWFLPYNPDDPANQTQVFAKADTTRGVIASNFGAQSDASGGVANLEVRVVGLGRVVGPISSSGASATSDPTAFQNALNNQFDPSVFFPPSAKLLGGTSLSKLIPTGGFDLAPKIQYAEGNQSSAGKSFQATLSWDSSKLLDDPTSGFTGSRNDGTSTSDASLSLSVTISKTVLSNGKSQSSRKYSGTLKNFKVSVAELLEIQFSECTFSRQDQEAIQFKADIAGFTFTGPLAFLSAFTDFLKFSKPEANPAAQEQPGHPADAGAPKTVPGNGITVQISTQGVTIGLVLRIPGFSVGFLSLTGISFTASCLLPFNGTPMVMTFAFASKAAPFTISFGIFGGRGYFSLEWTTSGSNEGITRLEADLEFGGVLQIGIAGVITGCAYAVGGVYYLKVGSNKTEINVYFRLGGAVSLLGIVTVSLDVYLGLDYVDNCPAHSKVETTSFSGQAQVTFSIHILFFSWSFTATFEKTFSGSTQKRLPGCPASSPAQASVMLPREAFLASGPNNEVPAEEDFLFDTLQGSGGINTSLNIAGLMTRDEWREYWEAFAA